MTTDASGIAIFAILSQGTIGQDLPIAFASRTLNEAETRYSATELELLAIVWGVEYFRPYIFGRHFIIFTDHKPLCWVMNIKEPNSRLIRWKLRLAAYDFEVIYKPGKSNCVADCLSRYITSKVYALTRQQAKTQNHGQTYEPPKSNSEAPEPEIIESSDNNLLSLFKIKVKFAINPKDDSVKISKSNDTIIVYVPTPDYEGGLVHLKEYLADLVTRNSKPSGRLYFTDKYNA